MVKILCSILVLFNASLWLPIPAKSSIMLLSMSFTPKVIYFAKVLVLRGISFLQQGIVFLVEQNLKTRLFKAISNYLQSVKIKNARLIEQILFISIPLVCIKMLVTRWWSRGESNPGPKNTPWQRLQFRHTSGSNQAE